jgi:oxygen-independent coproporphyrinogen-3 oxidase
VTSVSPALLDRYDRPGPRYTSYPPIPHWSEQFGDGEYREALAEVAGGEDPVAVYVHLPFCVERCWYCGCNATVTPHREVQRAYVDRLERELAMVGGALGGRRAARQIHWGGGTPNYLPVEEIDRLLELLRRHFDPAPGAELSIEIDPRVSSPAQLEFLRRSGFQRISFGVQDLDPGVQAAMGRLQPETILRELHAAAAGLGFHSINHDLVYGLPGQTAETFQRTLETVVELGPDRIACFGYAHVPWARANQRRIDAALLPGRYQRFALFQLAVETLTAAGYRWIGLDHFARPTDELAVALGEGRLRRNFMGYLPDPAPHLLAFGASGIGDVAGRFVQNDPGLGRYQRGIDAGRLPVVKGHLLSPDDRIRRAAIERLMCTLELPYPLLRPLAAEGDPLERFRPFADEGFVAFGPDRLRVTPLGRYFLRNLCMALDAYATPEATERFSRTV